jgi:hypothetical protein
VEVDPIGGDGVAEVGGGDRYREEESEDQGAYGSVGQPCRFVGGWVIAFVLLLVVVGRDFVCGG